MSTYSFVLHLEGQDVFRPEVIESLYASGCNDATFTSQSGRQFADFDREASSRTEAILSAIEAVETAVPGLVVVHVEPEDLVSASDIASRTGRSREGVSLLAEGQRGPATFPAPAARVGGKRLLWRWSEVAVWFDSYGGGPSEVTKEASVIPLINGALEVRRYAQTLGLFDQLRFSAWFARNISVRPLSTETEAWTPSPRETRWETLTERVFETSRWSYPSRQAEVPQSVDAFLTRDAAAIWVEAKEAKSTPLGEASTPRPGRRTGPAPMVAA
jgi:hypothetical protein